MVLTIMYPASRYSYSHYIKPNIFILIFYVISKIKMLIPLYKRFKKHLFKIRI